MSKLTITRVFRGKKQTKFGEKDNIAIKVSDPKYNDKWISTFKTKGTEAWKEGDTVELTVTQNGEYFNFEVGVTASGQLEERVGKLEEKVFGVPSVQIDELEKDEPNFDF